MTLTTEVPAETVSDGLPAHQPQTAIPLLRALLRLPRLVGQYPRGHAFIGEKVAELHDLVMRSLSGEADLHLYVIDNVLRVDGTPVHLDEPSAQVLREFTDLGFHSFRLRAGVRTDELLATAEFLLEYFEDPGAESVEARLARRDVQNIKLARILPLDTRWYARDWPGAPQGDLDPDYERALQLAENTFGDIASGRELDRVTIRHLVELLVGRVAHSSAALGQILAVKQYENLTYAHSVNVAMLSLLIGRKVGLAEPSIAALVEAALLHDIGKTRIPLDILRKPGALTTQERRIIELHPTYGAEILVGISGLSPLTPTVALEHHRTTQGAGYPDLGDGVIPHAMSQIVSVADTYEAITAARTYKDPTPPERACLILARVSGSQLNAAIVKAFVNMISFFPVGSFVRTSRDELAVVMRTNEHDPLHPVIGLLGEESTGVQALIDTSERDASGNYHRHVLRTVTPHEGAPELTAILPPARGS